MSIIQISHRTLLHRSDVMDIHSRTHTASATLERSLYNEDIVENNASQTSILLWSARPIYDPQALS